jgi:hypothetical protein
VFNEFATRAPRPVSESLWEVFGVYDEGDAVDGLGVRDAG